MKRCSIDNCKRVAYEEGLCRKHYAQWLDTGVLPDKKNNNGKSPDAVSLVRGKELKGGPAKLTPEQLSENMRRASNIRWGRTREGPRVPQHGTANEYGNYGCRCDACKKAHSEVMAAYNKRPCPVCGRPAWNRYHNRLCRSCAVAARTKPIVHGTETGYKKGCKCADCRGAAATSRRIRRRRQTAEALAR